MLLIIWMQVYILAGVLQIQVVVTNSLVSGNTLYHNDLAYALNDWTGECNFKQEFRLPGD